MESQVIRTYLENIAELPWNERSPEHLDLRQAETILDEDHYALGDVKDRVLEFLAVRQLKDSLRAASDEAEAPAEPPTPPEDGAGTEAPVASISAGTLAAVLLSISQAT